MSSRHGGPRRHGPNRVAVALTGLAAIGLAALGAGPPAPAEAAASGIRAAQITGAGWISDARAAEPIEPTGITPGTRPGAPTIGAGPAAGYIVVLRSRPGAAGARASAQAAGRADALGGRVRHRFSHAVQGYSADLTPGALAAVRRDPDVAYVVPNQVVRAANTQTDPPPNLDRIDQRKLPYSDRYNYVSTGVGVSAYVLDTGIFASHADFGSRVSRYGYTAIDDGHGTNDCAGHGTHVAGILGGSYFGVAKRVRLVPVRVLDCSGMGFVEDIIAGIDWIEGVRGSAPAVANMSLGVTGAPNAALDAAVRGLINSGVTAVVAAGNIESRTDSPSACQHSPSDVPAAITVGSVFDGNDTRDPNTDYGACVDLFAPGVQIYSDWNKGRTSIALLSGTSMATPHVAGAAAMYLQTHPAATPGAVTSALLSTATPNILKGVPANTANRMLFSLTPVDYYTPPTNPSSAVLTTGHAMTSGQRICAPGGLVCLTFGTDGRLALTSGSSLLWRTTAAGRYLINQSDGNLVSYDDYGLPVWATGTSSPGSTTLTPQDDGNLVLYRDADHRALWSTHTHS